MLGRFPVQHQVGLLNEFSKGSPRDLCLRRATSSYNGHTEGDNTQRPSHFGNVEHDVSLRAVSQWIPLNCEPIDDSLIFS